MTTYSLDTLASPTFFAVVFLLATAFFNGGYTLKKVNNLKINFSKTLQLNRITVRIIRCLALRLGFILYSEINNKSRCITNKK
jgi:hypothetical protein